MVKLLKTRYFWEKTLSAYAHNIRLYMKHWYFDMNIQICFSIYRNFKNYPFDKIQNI